VGAAVRGWTVVGVAEDVLDVVTLLLVVEG
jgi:hypothetical protein